MISAIILAAGESKRMGSKNKLLLPFKGESMIRRFVKSVCLSEVENVLVVLGYQSDKIKEVLIDQPVDFVYNPFYMSGMITSIKAGISASSHNNIGYMICLSDMPFLRTVDLNFILREFLFLKSNETGFVTVPIYGGQRGNPVIFSSEFREEILSYKGDGCRDIIDKNPTKVREVFIENKNIFYDIDTPEDYEEFTKKKIFN